MVCSNPKFGTGQHYIAHACMVFCHKQAKNRPLILIHVHHLKGLSISNPKISVIG